MINHDGQVRLLENFIYKILEVHGRQTKFDDLPEILRECDIIVDDQQVLRDAYDFQCDLFDDNLQFASTTSKLLSMLNDCMLEPGDQCSAPNTITELAYDIVIEDGHAANIAEDVANSTFSFASALVADVGKYE
jgi:hypothetical protein